MLTVLTFFIEKQKIKLKSIKSAKEILVSGTINEYSCQFEFDESWNDYTKIAVFKTKDYPNGLEINIVDNNSCIIPAQILKKPNSRFQVGVYGVKGNLVRPTIFSIPLTIQLGAIPTDKAIKSDPEFYQWIINKIEELDLLTKDVKELQDIVVPLATDENIVELLIELKIINLFSDSQNVIYVDNENKIYV